MVDLNIHQLYCRKFLQNLAEAQELLLRKEYQQAANEFELVYSCFAHELGKFPGNLAPPVRDDLAFRLQKQADRLLQFLDEFEGNLPRLRSPDYSEREALALFERQHRMKKVLQRHVADIDQNLSPARKVSGE